MIHTLFTPDSSLIYFDSLAAGCLAAMLLSDHGARLAQLLDRTKWNTVLAGIALILVPLLLLDGGRGGVILIPLAATFQTLGFVLLLLQSILFPQFFKALNWPVVRLIGVLSYSIYIWRQPFVHNLHEFGWPDVWFLSFPFWLLLAPVVAALSYYCLEKPFMGLRAYFGT